MFSQIVSVAILIFVIGLLVSRLIPSAVTAVLGCALFALFDICTIEEAFSGFSNSILLLMFGMMVVGIALSETGLSELIGEKIAVISRHNEKLFLLIGGLAAAALSTFLSNSSVIAIFLPLIEEMSRSGKKMNRLNITLPIALAAMFGGNCTLAGSTTQLAANGILTKMLGAELKMFDYMLPGIIMLAEYMLFAVLIGYPMGRKIWENRPTEENDDFPGTTERGLKSAANKKKKIIVSFIFLAIVVSFVGGWIDPSLTAVLGASLCVITGCTSFRNVVRKVDWTAVFVLAGCMY